jgi:glycosyltransferase involved in cell wall biosynthesis
LSVDPSTDGTEALAARLAATDARIRVLTGPGRGVQANFAQAIAATRGSLIFLSDHDDLWLPGKVREVRAAFAASDADLVLHDAVVVDANLEVLAPSFFALRQSRPGIARNFLRNSYIGCCMAFRAEVKPYILPFPPRLPMHDQWIGLTVERLGTVCFLDEVLVAYRRHGANASGLEHAPLPQMLRWRYSLLKALLTQYL